MPEKFRKWVEDNKEKIAAAASGKGILPYFIKDNQTMVDSILAGESVPAATTLAKQTPAVSASGGNSNNSTTPQVTPPLAGSLGPDDPDDSSHLLSVEAAKKEYETYNDKQWSKEGFENNGGYLVVWSDRKPTEKASKNERDVYKKESDMCKVFARNGYRMVMLHEKSGVSSPDVLINGIPADLKRTKGVNNIEKYAKKAVRKQGAKLVLIQFDEMNDDVLGKIRKLSSMNIHGKYFITGSDELFVF